MRSRRRGWPASGSADPSLRVARHRKVAGHRPFTVAPVTAAEQRFSVLLVCTGNICRSPVAERLLLDRVPPAAPVVVSSAGTHGLDGWPIDGPSALALREMGVDPDGHHARRLTPGMVADTDLVLTAESSHRSTILRAEPLHFRRVFTLLEFGRLGTGLGPLDTVNVESLRERVAQVADRRGDADAGHPPEATGADEIGDPYGARIEVARACAQRIAVGVDAALDALGLRR